MSYYIHTHMHYTCIYIVFRNALVHVHMCSIAGLYMSILHIYITLCNQRDMLAAVLDRTHQVSVMVIHWPYAGVQNCSSRIQG